MALHQQIDELIDHVLPVVQDFHRKGMFAPHAATVGKSGSISGHALTTDGTVQLSVSQTIEHFEQRFIDQAGSSEILATGIFYHSPGIDATTSSFSLPPATTTDECRTLVALLEHAAGDSIYLLIPYSGEPPTVEYSMGKLIEKPAKVFAVEQRQERKPWWKFW